MTACREDGCDRPIRARGLCGSHYMRAQRSGQLPPLGDGNCCAGHPCDGCRTCGRGRCCRKDNPVYRLPDPGSWSESIYGAPGELTEIGGGMQCHICGDLFDNLGSHADLAHDVTPHEYRAYFGLKRTAPLRSEALLRKHADAYRAQVRRDPDLPERALAGLLAFQEAWTPEQRSETFAGRKERPQATHSRPGRKP